MKNKNIKKYKNQLIVNNGIVYNKKDMLMLLRDLGNVNYYELVGGQLSEKGKGFIYRVCANSEEPTLFLSGRIYINVNSFDFLKLSKVKGGSNTLFELVSDERTIKIVPSLADVSNHPIIKGSFADKMAELGIFNEYLFGEDGPEASFGDGLTEN